MPRGSPTLDDAPAMPGGGQGDEAVSMAEEGQEIETAVVASSYLVPIPSALDHDMPSSHLVRYVLLIYIDL